MSLALRPIRHIIPVGSADAQPQQCKGVEGHRRQVKLAILVRIFAIAPCFQMTHQL